MTPTATSLTDRARREWFLFRFSWHMQDFPQKQYRQIKRDLRRELTTAGADVGMRQAVTDLGHPWTLAEGYAAELGRRVPRWTTGSAAATIPALAAATSRGISSRSAPATSARTASSPGAPGFTAPMSSASVTATPSKPRLSRSRRYVAGDNDDGTPGSICTRSRWPIMTTGAPTATAARNGIRSRASSCACVAG